ncbi:MAG TPA: hypothetical protein VFQ53_08315 [Kofleriaceae bacterium]|nr:hypothetical protein [Kofleriaceae bacterium]
MHFRPWIAGALLVAGLAAGCAKDVTKDIEKLADRACACAEKKDTACAKQTLDDLVKLAQDNQEARGDEAKAKADGARMMRCVSEAGVSADDMMQAVRKLQQ